MFTGIIREIGKIIEITPNHGGAVIWIESPETIAQGKVGDSISVNGVCLTVVEIKGSCWSANVVIETMQRTSLGHLKQEDPVNLERPLTYNGTMDGHFVQGHIDGIGTISEKRTLDDGSILTKISCSEALTQYIVHKGSIAIDGVSLTVIDVGNDYFSFTMIPHTAKVTCLGSKTPGSVVNLEVDILAKYVAKLSMVRK